MKKIILLPLVVLCICGCSQKEPILPVLSNISFTADALYSDQEYICDVTLLEDTINLTVIEPQEIKGLTLTLDQNGVTAEFNGISHTLNIDSLPQSAVVRLLAKVVDDAATKTIETNDQNCEITGKVEGKEYIFVFSPTGLPISLAIDDFDLSVKFSNVSLK